MTHNNMVPFFGGTIKQNTDLNQNTKTLRFIYRKSKFRTTKTRSREYV